VLPNEQPAGFEFGSGHFLFTIRYSQLKGVFMRFFEDLASRSSRFANDFGFGISAIRDSQ
jgi:hypothetical protein